MNFDLAFEIVVGLEGGYSNDLHDAGGETKYGISKRSYPYIEIRALTQDDAKRIYKRDYWDLVNGDRLPWPLALYVFDAAINQGPHQAVVLLQGAINALQDGVIGPDTLACIKAMPLGVTEARYMARRAQRYTQTQQYDRYGFGWFVRLFSIVQLGSHPAMSQPMEGSVKV